MPPSVALVGEVALTGQICLTAISVTPDPSPQIHHLSQQECPVNNPPPIIEVDPATATASKGEPTTEPVAEQLVAETLVEEVSIDGMCGVY
jgi:mycofactocin precursor